MKNKYLLTVNTFFYFGIINLCALPLFAEGNSQKVSTCKKNNQQKVIFKPQTIFNENEDGVVFLHRWANAIHIDTKIITLENETAFFLDKCVKTLADIAELERHLRSRKYLRDAKVTSDAMIKNITVTTWDNWSLLPTISFGRKGGKNTYSFGIKERNLLGLGIAADISTYKNSQREGYRIKSTIPLFNKQNTDLTLRFADNDDGTQQSLFLQKYFASFYTNKAYQLGFNEESRNDTLYQNNSELAIFAHDISYKNAEYAWLNYNNENELLRYRFGVTQNKHTFSYADNASNNPNSLFLPQDRDFIYPWIGFDYLEKEFKKLTNIHAITQVEDFNYGWQVNSRIGLSNGNKANSAWALFQVNINKGIEIHHDALLLMNVALSGDVYDQQDHRLLLNINTEYFYHINSNWTFYINNTNVISNNQYLDRPVTMGGNTGLRGFPLQYQYGEHSVKLTSEIRYYPYMNIFKLFDIAGAAFFDTGRTFGNITAQGAEENIDDNWLYSIGVGVRLYSPHSAGSNQVIHIDFAFPQSDNSELDSFEIRVEAKHSF